jgi:endonuclease/exonuclease/phosphatase family metal-dependent hydrolase
MRPALAALTIVVALAAGSFATKDAVADAPAGVKVMTFNIQHGIDGSHKYNLQRAIDTIARVRPDIVALQEVTRNHPYYNCDDQPARIAEGLKAATGRVWNVVYEQEWFTPNVECQQAGKGDGKETEGLAFLSPGSLGRPSTTALPASRIALTVRADAVAGLPITVTHLASGKNNGPARAKEVEALLQSSRKLGPDEVLMGDFNLKPDEPELQPLLTMFRDAWKTAADRGSATGVAGTHGESRIDYIFHRGRAVVTATETVETASLLGTAASDHRPLTAVVQLTPVLK